MLQKAEQDIRNHISCEQQLKVLLESAQNSSEEHEKLHLEKVKNQQSELKELKKKITQLESKNKQSTQKIASLESQLQKRKKPKKTKNILQHFKNGLNRKFKMY